MGKVTTITEDFGIQDIQISMLERTEIESIIKDEAPNYALLKKLALNLCSKLKEKEPEPEQLAA